MTSRRLTAAALVALTVVALTVVGCDVGPPRSAPSPSDGGPSTDVRTAVPTAAPTAAVHVGKVLVVVLENHSRDQAWKRMPYLRSLGERYGRATDYRAVTHPSLPNYLAIAGGSTFGVHDDAGPDRHRLGGATAFGQALAAGLTAKVYAEAMPAPCSPTGAGRYAVKHNPWPYFASEQASCRRFDVPAGTPDQGSLRDDVANGALPIVGLLVPDLCHDGHDCSLQVADAWLRAQLAPVLAGPDFRTGRLAVVVTFDEDDRFAGNRVLTVIAAAGLHGVVVPARLSHLSLSRWLSQLSGSPGLRDAQAVTSLGTAFGLAG